MYIDIYIYCHCSPSYRLLLLLHVELLWRSLHRPEFHRFSSALGTRRRMSLILLHQIRFPLQFHRNFPCAPDLHLQLQACATVARSTESELSQSMALHVNHCENIRIHPFHRVGVVFSPSDRRPRANSTCSVGRKDSCSKVAFVFVSVRVEVGWES